MCGLWDIQSSGFFKDFIYLFLEREEGRDKTGRETLMGERNIELVASHTAPTGDLAGNRTSDPSVGRPALNPRSYPSQGGI